MQFVFNVCQVKDYQNILKLSWRLSAFTSYKAYSKQKTKRAFTPYKAYLRKQKEVWN